ncbi:MAG: hypothetical protein WCP12_04545 [bacterium]
MKRNIIIGCVIFCVLAVIQFYLFRLESTGSLMYRNRYTNALYIPQDGMLKSIAVKESDSLKSLNSEISQLKTENSQLKSDLELLQKIDDLQKKKLNYQEEIISEINKQTKFKDMNGLKEVWKLCTLIECLKPDYQTVWIDGIEYTFVDYWSKVLGQNSSVKSFCKKAQE